MGRQSRLRWERRYYRPIPLPGLVETLYLMLVLIMGTARPLPQGPVHQKARRFERRKRSAVFDALLYSSGVE